MSWHLSPMRYEEIRSAAADFIEDWGIASYPFSVWELVAKMRIRLVRYSELSDGLREQLKRYWPDAITIYPADYNPAKTTIIYNDEQGREHIRFSVAHELAHLILMHPATGKEVYEHEADIFANYLLAPAPLVLRDSQLDADSISYDFQVSYGCACSARDRAGKRRAYGPAQPTEYEQRILAFCSLEGGGQLGC